MRPLPRAPRGKTDNQNSFQKKAQHTLRACSPKRANLLTQASPLDSPTPNLTIVHGECREPHKLVATHGARRQQRFSYRAGEAASCGDLVGAPKDCCAGSNADTIPIPSVRRFNADAWTTSPRHVAVRIRLPPEGDGLHASVCSKHGCRCRHLNGGRGRTCHHGNAKRQPNNPSECLEHQNPQPQQRIPKPRRCWQ